MVRGVEQCDPDGGKWRVNKTVGVAVLITLAVTVLSSLGSAVVFATRTSVMQTVFSKELESMRTFMLAIDDKVDQALELRLGQERLKKGQENLECRVTETEKSIKELHRTIK